MKVLLVRPDRTGMHLDTRNHLKRFGDLHQPLGLLYLAAMLDKERVTVNICDEIVGDSFSEMIVNLSPDIVGITVTSPLMTRAVELVAVAKKRGIRVILGGPHISALPRESLKESGADAVVIGEGEYTIVELCSKDDWSNIKGIAYWRNGELVSNQLRSPVDNLDILPFPARHILDFRKYYSDVEFGLPLRKNEKLMRILSSRGCPYQCTYCASHCVFGRKLRLRSAKNILDEIEEARAKWGVKAFMFADDAFTVSSSRLREISQLIIDKRLGIQWGCFSRVGLTPEMMKLMKKAGCKIIGFGVETGSPDILKIIKKDINIKEVVDTFGDARKVGIKTKAFFIVGLPGEREKEFRESMSLACRINPTYLWASIFIPLPGSNIYKEMDESGKIHIDWGKRSFFYTKDKVLMNRHRRLIRRFYLRPIYILNVLRYFSPEDLAYFLRMLKTYFVIRLQENRFMKKLNYNP